MVNVFKIVGKGVLVLLTSAALGNTQAQAAEGKILIKSELDRPVDIKMQWSDKSGPVVNVRPGETSKYKFDTDLVDLSGGSFEFLGTEIGGHGNNLMPTQCSSGMVPDLQLFDQTKKNRFTGGDVTVVLVPAPGDMMTGIGCRVEGMAQ